MVVQQGLDGAWDAGEGSNESKVVLPLKLTNDGMRDIRLLQNDWDIWKSNFYQ